nr:LamG-like jellyroll fold domain-containing protein [uncultured Flavobacterium sp.]
MKKTLLLLLITLSCTQTKAQCWKTIASGTSHTIGLRTDGTLWGWGDNSQGQLSGYSLTRRNLPEKIGTANDWKTVATGQKFTIALKTDGTLWAWGDNYYGQLCDGTTIDNNIPTQIGTANDWQTIATGDSHAVALKRDGTLWAWGNNYWGQVGDGTITNKNTPTQIGTATDWQTIQTGFSCTFAIKSDGTLWAWGDNPSGQLGDNTTTSRNVPTKIGTTTDWKTIASGYHHTVAIKTDGTIWGWGESAYGNLGNGSASDKYVPTQIGTSAGWKNVAVGGDHTIALKTDGSLWAWGYNIDGELGNGTNVNNFIPIQIGTAKNWQIVTAGTFHTVALNTDNSISTWGRNSDGQLGDGTYKDKNVPTLIDCPGEFSLIGNTTNVHCNGLTDGSASITSVSGGTAPYTYLWSNGATTETITGLPPGTYSCTVTDASLLSITNSFVITEPIPLIATTTSINTGCNGNNGIITITAIGGTSPYQYGLSNLVFQPSSVFTNLSAGVYELYVKDANGCLVLVHVIVTVNNTPPPTTSEQTFNIGATVANLQATGSNIQWYNDITGGTVLDSSTALQTGKYYASQTINGCESSRTAVDIIITPVSANEPIPKDGLLAYYPFTGNANDTSGKGNNGIATDVTLTEDRFGISNSAYSFNGTSSNIESTIANYPLKGGSRTITGWFKADVPTVSNESDFCLLNYGNINDPTYWFKISLYSKGYLDMQFDSKTFSSQENYFNNEWTFFAMTFDEKNNTYSLYINGVYKMGGVASLYTNGFDNLFRIGRNKLNNYFEGSIDDIGIWNRVLTQEEIKGLYTPANNDFFTLIPDSNFENKLITLGIDSGVPDGKVLTANIALETNLDVSNSNIADLTGIQGFLSITNLFCGSNQLTNLDVSKNTNLKQLSCGSNQLTNLDISKNIELTYLSCSINKLTNLDISKNTALTNLFCHTNLLTQLDVSNNPSLLDLYCDNNQLKSLDVSMNTSLMVLNCPENQLTNLDVSKNTALDTLSCYTNRLTALDVKINKTLKKLDCGSNQISTLDVSENTALTFLGCNTSLLTTLDVSKNTALTLLDCRENKLTSLDVSQITALTELYCQSNQLTNLDISKNKALEFLNCSKNQLTTLDVSINTALVGLYSNSNQLKNLNLKNGNNVKIGYLNLINNPNLSCIQVDDIDYFNTNWSSKKDAMANFNTDCLDSNPYTLIPDSNFEQKLIDLGIDTDGLNGKITIADISTITTLDLSNSNIKDLTGIENFTALNILDCSNNQLTALDLSKNSNLQILYVTGNPLVYINLKNGNNQNLIVESQTGRKTANVQGTSFLGLTALGCVKVDNVSYSDTNWSKIKETTTIYSETCTLGLEDSEFNKAIVYPNPTKGEINILNIALEKATVYNVLGQLVKTFVLDSANTNNTINLSGLPKGVYFVYLINQDAASVKKVIVE